MTEMPTRWQLHALSGITLGTNLIFCRNLYLAVIKSIESLQI